MARWISETFHPDWRPSMRADRILHEVETKHQHLIIFENAFWGKVLILDGVFQLTTKDEFVYHEMMAHIPMMALERPRDVLIVGGGDGGILREVLKHPSVQSATLVEIDQEVIDTSTTYYPEIGKSAFADKRTNVVIADGLAYVAQTADRFDVVIADSSEPIGPSAVLHSNKFYSDCKRILRSDGIFVSQTSLPFHTPGHLSSNIQLLSPLYDLATAYTFTHPSYFGGEFCVSWASDCREHLDVATATLAGRATTRNISTQYWTPALHAAAFALPAYMNAIIDKASSKSEPQN
ncbi:MAG: polyamine aminopropyltransferase [Hyphomicrobiaceae bacterium]